MYEVNVSQDGSFRYKVRAGDYEIKIDFPKDGRPAEGVNPPDLLLASLGSCMAVYLERYLAGAKIRFQGFNLDVKSDICKDSPHYLKNIEVRIGLKGADLDGKRKTALLEFIRNCPVHNTLLNGPKINIGLEEEL